MRCRGKQENGVKPGVSTFHTLGFKAALDQVGRGGLAHGRQTEVRAGRCAQVETRGDLFDRERGFFARSQRYLQLAS